MEAFGPVPVCYVLGELGTWLPREVVVVVKEGATENASSQFGLQDY